MADDEIIDLSSKIDKLEEEIKTNLTDNKKNLIFHQAELIKTQKEIINILSNNANKFAVQKWLSVGDWTFTFVGASWLIISIILFFYFGKENHFLFSLIIINNILVAIMAVGLIWAKTRILTE